MKKFLFYLLTPIYFVVLLTIALLKEISLFFTLVFGFIVMALENTLEGIKKTLKFFE